MNKRNYNTNAQPEKLFYTAISDDQISFQDKDYMINTLYKKLNLLAIKTCSSIKKYKWSHGIVPQVKDTKL